MEELDSTILRMNKRICDYFKGNEDTSHCVKHHKVDRSKNFQQIFMKLLEQETMVTIKEYSDI